MSLAKDAIAACVMGFVGPVLRVSRIKNGLRITGFAGVKKQLFIHSVYLPYPLTLSFA
jgi:hypothetical protein